MEWLIFIAVVLWLASRSIKKQTRRLEREEQKLLASNQRDMTVRNEQGFAATAGDLDFVEQGKDPETDDAGRVIVKIKSGSDIEIGLNLKHLSEELALKIAGKRGSVDEFSRRVKVRIFRDHESPYFNSFKVTTKAGEFIGWVLKDDSEMTALLFSQIEAGVKPLDARLKDAEFVVELSATFTGSWYDEWDEAEESTSTNDATVEIEEAYVRISDPAILDL